MACGAGGALLRSDRGKLPADAGVWRAWPDGSRAAVDRAAEIRRALALRLKRRPVDEQRENDLVFEDHGLKLLVDNESLPFVRGSVIDYEESLQGAGFKVSNPNVVAACGCGSSFRVAEEEQVSAV